MNKIVFALLYLIALMQDHSPGPGPTINITHPPPPFRRARLNCLLPVSAIQPHKAVRVERDRRSPKRDHSGGIER